jgi:asparagine synthase (glutamine-hydrolysing)
MSNHRVILSYNYGYKWHSNGPVAGKGWAFDCDGQPYEDEGLLRLFSENETPESIGSRARNLSGHYVVIVAKDGVTLAATDRCRSFPILYSKSEKGLILSDSVSAITALVNPQLNTDAIAEYLSAGFVTQNRTLYRNVFQVENGKILINSPDAVNIASHYQYLSKPAEGYSDSELRAELLRLLETVFGRLIAALNGRTVVIPLSGGYDSRLIASMFRRLHYNNVICYSFGKQGNPEAVMSEKVARTLGYQWFFFETSPELVKDFHATHEFIRYVDFAANGNSFYIIQDYFAVKAMRDRGLIPPDSVFMPGHSGDTIGGSNSLGAIRGNETLPEVARKIIRYKFNLSVLSKSRINTFEQQVLHSLMGIDGHPLQLYDLWSMNESHPKLFVNAVRVYEFFGYKFFLPLWDNLLLDFFAALPIHLKVGKKLYDQTLEEEIFKGCGVDFPGDKKAYRGAWVTVKGWLKKILPRQFVYQHARFDPVNGRVYSRVLLDDMRKKGISVKANNTNAIKAQWYINFLKMNG